MGTQKIFALNGINIEDLVSKLRARLKGNLPGEIGHARMSSSFRASQALQKPNNQTKISAVLILLYPHNGAIYFPIILRATYDGAHSGQIGLPGGKVEKSDKDIYDTALREAWEEIGLPKKNVEVIGKLSPLFVNASNHLMHPIIAYTHERPDFVLDPREVDKIFEVALSDLQNPAIIKQTDIIISPNIKINASYYDLANQVVWGATAMVLSEFLMIIE